MLKALKRGLAVAAIAAAFAPPGFAQTSADLGVTKMGPASATANSDVPYTLTIINNGPDDAAGATLTDTIPAGMTFVSRLQVSGPTFNCTDPGFGNPGTVSCSINPLPTGSSASFTFVFHIPTGTPDGTLFLNSVTATSDTPDPFDENNSAVAGTSTPPTAQADIFVTKTGPPSAGPATDVTFTIIVSNPSTNDATTVTMQDTLPAGSPTPSPMTFVSLNPPAGCTTPAPGNSGTINCTIGTLTANSAITYTLVGHIPPGTVSGTVYTNTAVVNAANDPDVDNNSSTAVVTVSSVDLAVTKSGPATVVAGSPVTYTITLSNSGPDNATNVVLSDPLPPGTTFTSLVQNTGPPASCVTPGAGANGTVTCGFSQFNNGASAQFTLVASVGNTASISNTASVTTDSFDTNTANNSATVTTAVTPSADLAVTKSDSPDPVIAGTNITYTIKVTNNGPSDAMSVSLSDAIPANTTFVSFTAPPGWAPSTPAVGGTGTVTATNSSLTAASSATFTLVVQVNVATAAGTTISNTASASSGTSDPNAANNTATATTLVAAAVSDLSITKSVSPLFPRYPLNFDLTFTLNVANGGPSAAPSVTVTDVLPANMTFVSSSTTQGTCTGTSTVTCAVGTLASGGVATITIHARTATAGTVTNTATVSSANPDSNPANNAASVTLVVVVDIPALSPLLLLLLAAALAAIALRLLTE